MTARELVTHMLMQINEEEELSHQVMNRAFAQNPLSAEDRAFAVRLLHGTLERQLTIDWILQKQTGKPVARMKAYIRNLMRMSVYQLVFLTQIPASAACNEAVSLAKKKGYTGLSGFVNGVLRAISRNLLQAGSTEAYLAGFMQDMTPTEGLCFRYAIPVWLMSYWETAYKTQKLEPMLESFLQEGSVTIRQNESLCSREELLQALQKDGISVTPGKWSNTAFTVAPHTGNPANAPAFASGLFTIQDESSILAGQLLPIKKGDHVLDLCAAPGGKSMHAADRLRSLGGGLVLSRDLTEKKVQLIRDNAKRMAFDNVVCQVWDARRPDPEQYERFDVVIADLPCSGLGVIGRKPDIKWKTTMEDILSLAKLQKQILQAAVRYVKPGGYLSYTTCTITREENQMQYEELLSMGWKPVDFSAKLPADLSGVQEKPGMLQIFPENGENDGFFIACFQKN